MTNRMKREAVRLYKSGRSLAGIADLMNSTDPKPRNPITTDHVEQVIRERLKTQ